VCAPGNGRVGIEPAVNLGEQYRCYEAILEAFWKQPWFYGMYWWKWDSDLDRGGSGDGDFTPRRKPAEQILSEWYKKPVSRTHSRPNAPPH